MHFPPFCCLYTSPPASSVAKPRDINPSISLAGVFPRSCLLARRSSRSDGAAPTGRRFSGENRRDETAHRPTSEGGGGGVASRARAMVHMTTEAAAGESKVIGVCIASSKLPTVGNRPTQTVAASVGTRHVPWQKIKVQDPQGPASSIQFRILGSQGPTSSIHFRILGSQGPMSSIHFRILGFQGPTSSIPFRIQGSQGPTSGIHSRILGSQGPMTSINFRIQSPQGPTT